MVTSKKRKKQLRKNAANRHKEPYLCVDGRKIVLNDIQSRYILFDLNVSKEIKLDKVLDRLKKYM